MVDEKKADVWQYTVGPSPLEPFVSFSFGNVQMQVIKHGESYVLRRLMPEQGDLHGGAGMKPDSCTAEIPLDKTNPIAVALMNHLDQLKVKDTPHSAETLGELASGLLNKTNILNKLNQSNKCIG